MHRLRCRRFIAAISCQNLLANGVDSSARVDIQPLYSGIRISNDAESYLATSKNNDNCLKTA